MVKQIDNTNLGGLLEDIFGRIKAAFWKKGDTQQIPIDNAPTKSSNNLVKSGGVYSEIHSTIETTQPQNGFLPNIFYNLGQLTGNITFSIATPSDATILNHYYLAFETGSTAPTITWPNSITWVGGAAPTISANKHYEISILNGIGTFIEV